MDSDPKTMERHKLKVAVYLLLLKGNQVLLSRRFNTGWHDGNYSLPAGHLDPNETIPQGLLREVKEEIGLIIKPENIQLVFTMHRMNQYIDFFFTSKYSGIEPENKEPEKCDELSWHDLNNLPKNMVPSVRFAINNYLNKVTLGEFENEG